MTPLQRAFHAYDAAGQMAKAMAADGLDASDAWQVAAALFAIWRELFNQETGRRIERLCFGRLLTNDERAQYAAAIEAMDRPQYRGAA